jgi:c-di-GMP-binding flagellar brake protein YcgR
MIVRVQPEHPIDVAMKKGEMSIRGQIADISLNGIGVVVTNPVVKKDETYEVQIPLPDGTLTIPGRVVNVIPMTGTNRLSVKFTANSRDVALILKYISNRRIEIETEIKRLYDRVFQAAKS